MLTYYGDKEMIIQLLDGSKEMMETKISEQE